MQRGAVIRPHMEGRQAERTTQEGQTAASQNGAGQQRWRDSDGLVTWQGQRQAADTQASPGSGGALTKRMLSQGSWPLHLSILHLPSQRNHKAPFLVFF